MNAEVLKAGKSSCALSQPCEGECGTNLQSNKKLTKQFQACAKEVHGKLLSDGMGVDKGTEHELALIGCPVTECGDSAMLDPVQKPTLPDRRGGFDVPC